MLKFKSFVLILYLVIFLFACSNKEDIKLNLTTEKTYLKTYKQLIENNNSSAEVKEFLIMFYFALNSKASINFNQALSLETFKNDYLKAKNENLNNLTKKDILLKGKKQLGAVLYNNFKLAQEKNIKYETIYNNNVVLPKEALKKIKTEILFPKLNENSNSILLLKIENLSELEFKTLVLNFYLNDAGRTFLHRQEINNFKSKDKKEFNLNIKELKLPENFNINNLITVKSEIENYEFKEKFLLPLNFYENFEKAKNNLSKLENKIVIFENEKYTEEDLINLLK